MEWGLPDWSYGYLLDRINEVEREHGWTRTAIYPYLDADGQLSYVKARFIDNQNHKTFRQWAISAKRGWVACRKAGKEPLLYRRNTLDHADEIFVVNGERMAG